MTRRETGRAYYNEHDPFAANWLRNLIDKNLVAPGDVDERSITDVQPSDLDGYIQHHFFGGVGGWSYALRLAGWPDERPVITGSCPCQPFSSAGKGEGLDDDRHLWPAFRWLLAQRRPATVFGEQVASKAGREWLAGVRADLEAMGYGVGASDLCAAGVGAPHIRQRLFWVADANGERSHAPAQGGICPEEKTAGPRYGEPERRCGLVNPLNTRPQRHAGDVGNGDEPGRLEADATGSTAATSWHDFDLVRCVEPTKEPGRFVEKWRRVEPGTLPLAHGIPARVGRLRGYGNAIVPYLAAEFIRAAATAPLGGRDEDTT